MVPIVIRSLNYNSLVTLQCKLYTTLWGRKEPVNAAQSVPSPARRAAPALRCVQHTIAPPAGARELAPERVADFAQQRLCRGGVWAYNDPAVRLEWTLDGLKLARAGSRFTILVSSGYFSAEALAAIGPYLDGLRLDLLGWTDRAYLELGGLRNWQSILEGAAWLRTHWNMHIKVYVPLYAGINDAEREIEGLARWMYDTLGNLTPLHLAAGDGKTSVQGALAAARSAGLAFVYGPNADQTTRCPRCGSVVVARGAGLTRLTGVQADLCESCGAALGLRTSIFRRQTPYRSHP